MQAVRVRTMEARLEISEIARQYYDSVFRFCARRVGTQSAADAAQETFLTAQRALSRYRGESSLRTWLLGIAHNECRRLARIRKLQEPSIEWAEGADSMFEQTMVDRHALQEALKRLSPEHREAVILHEVEGLSYEEAAAVIGVPAGTVKSRLHHAFASMRRYLQDQGGVR